MPYTTRPATQEPLRNPLHKNQIHDVAMQWRALGASPVPVRVDGSKAPDGTWKT